VFIDAIPSSDIHLLKLIKIVAQFKSSVDQEDFRNPKYMLVMNKQIFIAVSSAQSDILCFVMMKYIDETKDDAVEVLNSTSASPETTINAQIQDFALSSLLSSPHPTIVKNQSDLWEQILKRTNMNAKIFIVSKKANIAEVIMTNYRSLLMYGNALSKETNTEYFTNVGIQIFVNTLDG
jgi:hypothetical protein